MKSRGRLHKEREAEEKRKRKQWLALLALMIIAVVILAVAFYLSTLKRATPSGRHSCPEGCLSYDPPVPTLDGHGGVWISLNVTFMYENIQTLRNQQCTNFTVNFTFGFQNGSKYWEHQTFNLSGDFPPDYDYRTTLQWHWSRPEFPTTLQVTSCTCNG